MRQYYVLLIFSNYNLPVAVKQDNNVGCGQVNTQTACTSSQKEDEFIAARLVVFVNCINTILLAGLTINAAVFWRQMSASAQIPVFKIDIP